MHHPVGYAGRRHVFAGILAGPAIGQVLHDLHSVAVRIHHRDLLIPDPVRGHLVRRLPARSQVLPHTLDVVGVEP